MDRVMPRGLVIVLLTAVVSFGQSTPERGEPWQVVDSGTGASLRGLHVLSDQLAWASGTGGTVLRTEDGGRTWKSLTVPGAEALDFRDIQAWDARSAVVANAGQPARIYRTTDGGENWRLCFEHPHEKAFLDAISFWDRDHGIAMSDPVDERLLLLETRDGGNSWQELPPNRRPLVIPGEGGFAASGTNMRLLTDGACLIALGAALPGETWASSRLARSVDRGETWTFHDIPLARSESGGVFSLAFADQKLGVAVGGDYLQPNATQDTVALTRDGGQSWVRATQSLSGYRSGAAARRDGARVVFCAVGTNGTDRSDDGGETWKRVSETGFHAVRFSPSGQTLFACGSEGRLGRWEQPQSGQEPPTPESNSARRMKPAGR